MASTFSMAGASSGPSRGGCSGEWPNLSPSPNSCPNPDLALALTLTLTLTLTRCEATREALQTDSDRQAAVAASERARRAAPGGAEAALARVSYPQP